MRNTGDLNTGNFHHYLAVVIAQHYVSTGSRVVRQSLKGKGSMVTKQVVTYQEQMLQRVAYPDIG